MGTRLQAGGGGSGIPPEWLAKMKAAMPTSMADFKTKLTSAFDKLRSFKDNPEEMFKAFAQRLGGLLKRKGSTSGQP